MRKLAFLFFVFVGGVAPAQEYDADQLAEIERRKNFQAGFEAIVEDLNNQSVLAFTRAIDHELFLDRVFSLRLIDARLRKHVSENIETSLPMAIEQHFERYDGNIRAHLLAFDSRGEMGRATVRYDLPSFQFTYHEYELRWDDDRNRVVILDWVDFLHGQSYTESNSEDLIAQAPTRAAVRKLIENRNATDAQIFQLTELVKSVGNRNVDRFVQIFEPMDERLKAERSVVRMHAQFMRAMRKRRNLRTALIEMDKHFPEEPLFSLALLDLYFPSRQYDKALGALLRLESRLGVEDSAMKARLSAGSLAAGNVEDAVAYGEQSLNLQPDLELGWWSLLRASVVAGNNARAVESLTRLEDDFGHTLNREAFARDRSFAAFVSSAEFRAWSEGRHTKGND